MGYIVIRMVNPARSVFHILAMTDDDTLHEYFHDYLADGWTQEILSYVRGDGGYDYIDEMEAHEMKAHAWMREK